MGISLIIKPDFQPSDWETFIKSHPQFSVALDGYIKAPPMFEARGPFANFDHHSGVDRLSTRATCAQMLLAIRQGLFQTFTLDGKSEAKVFVNDCDEDVCCSWFLMKEHVLAENIANPSLNKLVSVTDLLDSTAGSYAISSETHIIQSLAWIYEPYRRARISGDLERRDPETFRNIIDDVCRRIMAFISGQGGTIPLDTRYGRMGGGKNWTMIREIGVHGRTGAFTDGIRAYAVTRDRKDGSWAYTIGRQSQFVPFDVLKLLARLSEAENDPARVWGGGNTVGGSSRVNSSSLSPETVQKIINENLG